MALTLSNMEERIEIQGGTLIRYGWHITDDENERRRVGFLTMRNQVQFVDAIDMLLSKFINTEHLNIRLIAALLFKYEECDQFVTLHLEHELYSHDDMDWSKTETIHEIVERIEEHHQKMDFAPDLIVRAELKKRGLDVEA